VIRRRTEEADADVAVEVVDQEGDGVADAYDTILDHIEGEYDLFVTVQTGLVVDDDWLAGHVETHLDHPEIDIVNGRGTWNDPLDREVGPDEAAYYVGRNFSSKAGVLERIDGWDTNFLRGEDWDMRIRLAGAGVRSYARSDVRYEWQDEPERYVTLSKARRKPTSATFLSKYGLWYAWFHPSHAVADALSVTALLLLVGAGTLLPLQPVFAAAAFSMSVATVAIYYAAHLVVRRHVQMSWLVGPIRKQLLNGVAVVSAIRRLSRDDPDWNMAGFDPENVPRYKF